MKILCTDADMCSGGRRCELACSFAHFKTFNPQRSAIRIAFIEPGGVRVPLFCTQCGLCIDSCPLKALKRGKAGAVIVDDEKCDGCELCIQACPWGLIFLDPKTNQALKCDLCGGDPECVKICGQKALRFEDVNTATYWRRKGQARGSSMTSLYRRLWRYREE